MSRRIPLIGRPYAMAQLGDLRRDLDVTRPRRLLVRRLRTEAPARRVRLGAA